MSYMVQICVMEAIALISGVVHSSALRLFDSARESESSVVDKLMLRPYLANRVSACKRATAYRGQWRTTCSVVSKTPGRQCGQWLYGAIPWAYVQVLSRWPDRRFARVAAMLGGVVADVC